MSPLHRLAASAAVVAAALGVAAAPSAAAVDRNHDRLPDAWEKRHHLSLKVKQTRRDPDRDGLHNLGEYRAGTNPRKADSDRDGIKDGQENAGTIASFDDESGVLTIALAGGGRLSGEVGERTKVTCPSSLARAARVENEDQDGEDEGDDDDLDFDDADEVDELVPEPIPAGDAPPAAGENDPADVVEDGQDPDVEDDPDGEDFGDAEDDEYEDELAGCELTPGTKVRGAALKRTSAGAVWRKVELGR